jgi:hypothetical protein
MSREGKVAVMSADGASSERDQISILQCGLSAFPLPLCKRSIRQTWDKHYPTDHSTLRCTVAVPSWLEMFIFVVVAALLIVLVWHFPKLRRK